jgi:hypothetical protein
VWLKFIMHLGLLALVGGRVAIAVDALSHMSVFRSSVIIAALSLADYKET